MKKIAITLGDTNSIGVEVAVKALNSLGEKNFVPVLIGSRTIFKNHLQRMNLELISDFEFFDIDETLLSNKKDSPRFTELQMKSALLHSFLLNRQNNQKRISFNR